jgi:hypothetical protein
MATVAEVLSGILRFFPNVMIMTLLVVGIALSKLPWIMVGSGGLLLIVFILLIQYVFGKFGTFGILPGASIMDSCSLLPVVRGGTYNSFPSMWTALTFFFCTYILVNAAQIYTQKPAVAASATIPVQQRKGTGLISMLAVLILLVMLVISRMRTGCETWYGMLTGGILGGLVGIAWWYILDACGSNVLPDIHGVMLGLTAGITKGNPQACTIV